MKRPDTATYTDPVPDYGELMTVEEYLAAVDRGSFIDYDGHGEAVRDGLVARHNPFIPGPNDPVVPSDRDSKIPLDATHVVWYNR